MNGQRMAVGPLARRFPGLDRFRRISMYTRDGKGPVLAGLRFQRRAVDHPAPQSAVMLEDGGWEFEWNLKEAGDERG